MDINKCYCVVQIDGKYRGSSGWGCVGYGFPLKKLIPKKFLNKDKYRVCKIGSFAK